jgi:hypothetical protein
MLQSSKVRHPFPSKLVDDFNSFGYQPPFNNENNGNFHPHLHHQYHSQIPPRGYPIGYTSDQQYVSSQSQYQSSRYSPRSGLIPNNSLHCQQQQFQQSQSFRNSEDSYPYDQNQSNFAYQPATSPPLDLNATVYSVTSNFYIK